MDILYEKIKALKSKKNKFQITFLLGQLIIKYTNKQKRRTIDFNWIENEINRTILSINNNNNNRRLNKFITLLESYNSIDISINKSNRNIFKNVQNRIEKNNNKKKYSYGISLNFNLSSTHFSKFIDEYIKVFNNYNNLAVEWQKLSTGQKTLLNLYSRFFEAKKLIEDDKRYADRTRNTNTRNIIIIIDEGENYLHPNWQREYIKITTDFFQQIFKNYKIQIILTSNSPFLISDIPKENIIFLKNSNGYCHVSKINNQSNTFVANIHTLLSNNFFMKKGLIGEFAKEKINYIIRFLKFVEKYKDNKRLKCYYSQKSIEFWQIHNIIGDDYLKQVIENYLIEIEKKLLGKNKAKENKIKRLKEEINLLEND